MLQCVIEEHDQFIAAHIQTTITKDTSAKKNYKSKP
jgi:hypothetical protein